MAFNAAREAHIAMEIIRHVPIEPYLLYEYYTMKTIKERVKFISAKIKRREFNVIVWNYSFAEAIKEISKNILDNENVSIETCIIYTPESRKVRLI